jgi:hypothetical protein
MGSGLTDISASNTLDFYLDKKNINNQDLVRDTISHFETIRKGIFKPLEFLNLLTKQFYFVLENIVNPVDTFKTLKNLPLTPKQKHILYYFIIKWHGGVGSLNSSEAYVLRLIENEFKRYNKNTPEKELYFKSIPQIYQLTFKQMELLKLKFDKLSYAEKLKFWDEKIKNDIDIYTISSVGFYRENEIKELGIVSDSSISIYPNDKVELEQHNRWLFNHIQTDKALRHCHFESLKESYFETINNNPRAIEYTEQEIYAIKEQRDKEKKYSDEKRNVSLWGYYLGYQSVVKKENFYLELAADKFKRIGVSYAKGIADAHYLGFLEKQLEKLKMGENVLPLKAESISDKVNNTQKQQYSRFEFTKQKLETQLLEIAKSNGHTSMMPYLKELLEKIKTFDDFDFECDFFLNLHYICKEHAKEFWSKGHREEITKFLGNARIMTDVFQHTWDYYNNPQPDTTTKKTDSKKEPEIEKNNLALTNSGRLQTEFKNYGFDTLDLIKALSEEAKFKLIELIVANGLPYKIAMLDYVGFISHLEKEHFSNKIELYNGIAVILKSDKRAIKGNILVLNANSSENRERYTAFKQIKAVEKDYQKISKGL